MARKKQRKDYKLMNKIKIMFLFISVFVTIPLFSASVDVVSEIPIKEKEYEEIRTNYIGTNYRTNYNEIFVENLISNTVSISCLEIKWDNKDREYEVGVKSLSDKTFEKNVHILKKENGLVYLTGLRENSEYEVTVTPVLKANEKAVVVPETLIVKTEKVTVIKEYEREEGRTNCFAGERSSGLTLLPSSEAIEDSVTDWITDTGVKRNKHGDYCVAMGLWYGEVKDRFLIELENGIQFTVEICDSKGMASDGEGKYHNFGEDGKCIVEFIYDEEKLPSNVAISGSWGYYNWNGLDLTSNILSIKQIERG